VYQFSDSPPEPKKALDYRLKVHDRLGQSAGSEPTISLPAIP
jgi:hypothetical protein